MVAAEWALEGSGSQRPVQHSMDTRMQESAIIITGGVKGDAGQMSQAALLERRAELLSRRSFLVGSAASLGAAGLAGCAASDGMSRCRQTDYRCIVPISTSRTPAQRRANAGGRKAHDQCPSQSSPVECFAPNPIPHQHPPQLWCAPVTRRAQPPPKPKSHEINPPPLIPPKNSAPARTTAPSGKGPLFPNRIPAA